MAETYQESTAPYMPDYSFAPENFRRIIQRQITGQIGIEVDAALRFTKGNNDGRYSNSFPHQIQYTSNQHGYKYFVLGSSRLGLPYVCGP